MKIYKHFKKIIIHKYYVAKHCFKLKMYKRGVLHDLSKFSPTEFIESVRYYQGNRSPIDACKEDKGYSESWFHHKGRNKHHYEFWVDYLDDGGVPVRMPFTYATELVCDWLGAGQAYMGEGFTYKYELDFVKEKFKKGIKMHKDTEKFVIGCLEYIVENSYKSFNIHVAKRIYDNSMEVENV